MGKKDSIIILAWPQTLASEIQMWYDLPMKWLGVNKKGYYKAGHAAAVLIHHKSGELNYFDFGRYHMPYKYGRVRDKETDPDCKLQSQAHINTLNEVTNLREILDEINGIKAFHGTGKMYATHYKGIDYDSAYSYAKKEQAKDMIPYGPFTINGNNCSRFINRLVRHGNPIPFTKFKLLFSLTLTPTTKWNIKAAIQDTIYIFDNNDRNTTFNSTKKSIEKYQIQSNINTKTA